MKYKKMISLMLALGISMCFVGCGEKENSVDDLIENSLIDSKAETAKETEESVEEIMDLDVIAEEIYNDASLHLKEEMGDATVDCQYFAVDLHGEIYGGEFASTYSKELYGLSSATAASLHRTTNISQSLYGNQNGEWIICFHHKGTDYKEVTISNVFYAESDESDDIGSYTVEGEENNFLQECTSFSSLKDLISKKGNFGITVSEFEDMLGAYFKNTYSDDGKVKFVNEKEAHFDEKASRRFYDCSWKKYSFELEISSACGGYVQAIWITPDSEKMDYKDCLICMREIIENDNIKQSDLAIDEAAKEQLDFLCSPFIALEGFESLDTLLADDSFVDMYTYKSVVQTGTDDFPFCVFEGPCFDFTFNETALGNGFITITAVGYMSSDERGEMRDFYKNRDEDIVPAQQEDEQALVQEENDVIDWMQFIADYKINKAAADEKYLNEKITITGYVYEIDDALSWDPGNYIVRIGNLDYSIDLYFDYSGEINSLKMGDQVTVTGMCIGVYSNHPSLMCLLAPS